MFRARSVRSVWLILSVWVLGAVGLSGCGGSSSQTPFPPEPLDVNLEAEDMSPQDPYKAARPEAAGQEPEARRAEPQPTSAPAPSAPKPAGKPAPPARETPAF